MRTKLLTDPTYKLRPGLKKSVLQIGDLRIWIDDGGKNKGTAVVETMFQFDGSSGPRIVRWLIDSDDLGYRPPAGHDFFYRHRGQVQGFVLTRAQVDRLFLLHMKQDGVPRWKRYAAYAAVRVGGIAAWRD